MTHSGSIGSTPGAKTTVVPFISDTPADKQDEVTRRRTPQISEIRFIAEPVNLYRAPAHSTSSFPAMQPEGGWGNDPAQGFVCQRVPQVSAGVLAYDRDPDPGYPGHKQTPPSNSHPTTKNP